MKKTLIIMLSIAVLFGFAACDNTTSANEDPIATIKWVDNMMGSNDGSGTRADNAATNAALEEGAYFDEDGALHATFKPIDNTKFTAYSAGMTGYGYYACYDINIDALTATADSAGTYLIYTIQDGEKSLWGTSASRAKCTKIGDYDKDATDNSYLTDITIKYYVVTGEYTRQTNTDTSMPEELKVLIDGKSPVFTFSVAKDSKFTAPTPEA